MKDHKRHPWPSSAPDSTPSPRPADEAASSVTIRLRVRRVPFLLQLTMHLAVSLWLVSLARGDASSAGPSSPPEPRDKPFTTQMDMLMVTAMIYPDKPPQVVRVQPLPQGRRTVIPPGDYTLLLLDAEGEPLYTLPFQVSFYVHGVPTPLPEMPVVLVAPHDPTLRAVQIRGPAGAHTLTLEELTDG